MDFDLTEDQKEIKQVARQLLSDVGHAADVVASGIKDVGVDVQATANGINENEIALPRTGLAPLMESKLLHQAA